MVVIIQFPERCCAGRLVQVKNRVQNLVLNIADLKRLELISTAVTFELMQLNNDFSIFLGQTHR